MQDIIMMFIEIINAVLYNIYTCKYFENWVWCESRAMIQYYGQIFWWYKMTKLVVGYVNIDILFIQMEWNTGVESINNIAIKSKYEYNEIVKTNDE